MTPVVQTRYEKSKGNCLTACVASILDVPITAVPEFCANEEWFDRLNNFCCENGFFLLYWKHTENMPIVCLNSYVIMLLELEDVADLHAVVAKSSLEDKQFVSGSGDVMWRWHTELIHDPNEKEYPPVTGVLGYIMIGKQ